MADTSTATSTKQAIELGCFVRGVYLGCGQRVFGNGLDKRVVSAISVALPNLGGALEIGVEEIYLDKIHEKFDMGETVEVRIDTPRAYNGRVYYNALRVGDLDTV